MRLYVSKKEIPALKDALRNAKTKDPFLRDIQITLLERVLLCEQLQDNYDKSENRA